MLRMFAGMDGFGGMLLVVIVLMVLAVGASTFNYVSSQTEAFFGSWHAMCVSVCMCFCFCRGMLTTVSGRS